MGSADVSDGDTILGSQQRDLRDDMIDQLSAADQIFVSITGTAGTMRTLVTQAIATAGTSTVVAPWTPERVKQAIVALEVNPAITVETFETALTGTQTFNTGALSKEPKLVIVIGIASQGTGTNDDMVMFMGMATGTGTGAKSVGLTSSTPGTAATSKTALAGDADSVGGIDLDPQGGKDTSWPDEDLDVTVFSKASGITLDWSATDIAFSNIKMTVIEFE